MLVSMLTTLDIQSTKRTRGYCLLEPYIEEVGAENK